jgi:hypothetical protein
MKFASEFDCSNRRPKTPHRMGRGRNESVDEAAAFFAACCAICCIIILAVCMVANSGLDSECVDCAGTPTALALKSTFSLISLLAPCLGSSPSFTKVLSFSQYHSCLFLTSMLHQVMRPRATTRATTLAAAAVALVVTVTAAPKIGAARVTPPTLALVDAAL